MIRNTRWTQWSIFALLCLLFLAPPFALAQENEAETIPFDTPLCKYKGKEFTVGYFLTFLGNGIQQLEDIKEEDKRGFLERQLSKMYFDHLVYDMAMEDGQAKDPAFIVGSRNLKHHWLSNYVVQKQFHEKVEISEEEIEKRYEQNKEQYHLPGKFTFWHIFTQTRDRSEEQQKQAKEKIQKAKALIESGSSFIAVAEDYSESRNKGKLMGPFKPREEDPEHAINPKLEDTALSLDSGEVSDIIQTRHGYNLIKLKEYTPAHYRPLEKLKGRIRQELYREKMETWKANFLDKHWDEAVKEYNPNLLFNLKKEEGLVAQVYDHKITKENYSQHGGVSLQANPNESAVEYKQRVIDQLRNLVIFSYIAAKVARDKNYDEIPNYKYNIRKEVVQRGSAAWWDKFVKEKAREKPITKEEKQEVYKKYPRYFKEPQKLKVREMQFHVPEVESEDKYVQFKAQNQAYQKAKKAIARVQEGELFSTVAKDMSESNTAQNGGTLGYVTIKSDLLPNRVTSKLFRMQEGETVKEPILDEKTYYVVQCAEKPEREPMDFDAPETQERLEQAVLYLRSQEVLQEYQANLVDYDNINILYEDFYSLEPAQVEPVSNDVPAK